MGTQALVQRSQGGRSSRGDARGTRGETQAQSPKAVHRRPRRRGADAEPLFGGARPREEALKEAGRDWQAEDLKRSVGAVKRKEFKEEKELKAKIQAAKDAGENVSPSSSSSQNSPPIGRQDPLRQTQTTRRQGRRGRRRARRSAGACAQNRRRARACRRQNVFDASPTNSTHDATARFENVIRNHRQRAVSAVAESLQVGTFDRARHFASSCFENCLDTRARPRARRARATARGAGRRRSMRSIRSRRCATRRETRERADECDDLRDS